MVRAISTSKIINDITEEENLIFFLMFLLQLLLLIFK